IGHVIILPDPLTYYRVHGQNLYHGSRARAPKYDNGPRLWTRASIYECLRNQLPLELEKRGCDLSLINLLLGPVQVQASRLKLMTSGGTPFENFRSERRAAAIDKKSKDPLNNIIVLISLGLTLVLPPKWYFRVREKYSTLLHWIRRWSLARGGA